MVPPGTSVVEVWSSRTPSVSRELDGKDVGEPGWQRCGEGGHDLVGGARRDVDLGAVPAAARAEANNRKVTASGRLAVIDQPPIADIGRSGWVKAGSSIP